MNDEDKDPLLAHFHFSEIFNKLDVNGVCITTNTVFNVSYRTIGWYDLKTSTTGFIKA
jgi:hypothetical protein